MGTLKIILTIIQLLVCIGLVAVVLFQTGKRSGLSGAIAGTSDTYLVKNKARTLDAKLAKMTKWIAIVFVILTLILNMIG